MANLYKKNSDINYENFVAECPYCTNENIFNRASDLKSFAPVTSKAVRCFKCKRGFRIKSDSASEKHRYLIYDCAALLELKRYMYCIINLCIACEAFFLKGIEIKILWEPWENKVFGRNADVFNSCSKKLYVKTKDYTYFKLLNVFLDLYLKNRSFQTQTSIDDYIDAIDCFAKIEPNDEDIRKYHNQKTRDFFLRLKKLKINETRNRVVHKHAFRPSRQEAEKHLEEVRNVVFNLETRLKMKHTVTYFNRG